MIQEKIRQRILEKAISLRQIGFNDIAYERHDAIDLIKSLTDENIIILGGDVYRVKHGKPVPLFDSWSCDPIAGETREEYSLRSKTESLQYIEKYPRSANSNFLFSLVFDDFFDTSSADDLISDSEAKNPLSLADALTAQNLSWLINWYNKECIDGCGRFQISSEKGPSWNLAIDIQKTGVSHKPFVEFTVERSEDNWACCFVKDGEFQGYGGPKNLPELLQIFRQWVTESEKG